MANCGSHSDTVTSSRAISSAFPLSLSIHHCALIFKLSQTLPIRSNRQLYLKNTGIQYGRCRSCRLSTTFLKWRTGARFFAAVDTTALSVCLSPHCVTLQCKSLNRRSLRKVLSFCLQMFACVSDYDNLCHWTVQSHWCQRSRGFRVVVFAVHNRTNTNPAFKPSQ